MVRVFLFVVLFTRLLLPCRTSFAAKRHNPRKRTAKHFAKPMVQWKESIREVPATTVREQLQEVPLKNLVEVVKEVPRPDLGGAGSEE